MKQIFCDSKKKSPATWPSLSQVRSSMSPLGASRNFDEFHPIRSFYPHKGIPIPYSEPRTAKCVEGIWQGLKVFAVATFPPPMLR
ncbi:MAG: hypothetical protein U0176_12845 [Bacteroidia bacterium]